VFGLILKKLEIYGFKSFADKIYMNFDKGITAIVGPNGSGKSNIADAIRWVLGEQSAKSLRGSKMEDIIFSGTQVRKPLGFAEVSITIDNSDLVLPIEYTEVTISRRVFRSGESEYYINRSACRLKDIIELLMDTGIGKEGYSIIGQGRIDEILSNRSEERRYIFEEAAGIVKYKTRREEAERKLEKTYENLTRVEDIIAELELQLEPLQEQAAIAKVYLKYKDRLKLLEINQFLHQYNRHSDRIGLLKTQSEQLHAEILKRKDELELKEQEKIKVSDELNRLKDETDRLKKQHFDLINTAERLRGELNLYHEKLKQLEKDNQRLVDEIAGDKQAAEAKDKELAELTAILDGKKKELADNETRLKQLVSDITLLDTKLAEKQKAIEESKGSIIEVLNKISECREKLTRFRTMEDHLVNRQQQIVSLYREKEQSKAELMDKLASIHNNIMLTSQRICDKQLHKQSLEQLIRDTKHTLAAMDSTIQQTKQQLEGQKSRYKLLDDMVKGYEGFNKSVREILLACSKNHELAGRVCGAVASIISVPRQYETAIETVLGPSLQHIVTENEEDAKALIEFLKVNNYGRATFLPISTVRGRYLNADERSVISMKGCIGIASELVTCEKKYSEIIGYLLGRVVIAEDLDAAIRIARRFSHTFRIVTLDGDIINAGGSMTGGSNGSKGSSILGRNRELIELADTIQALEALLEKQQAEQAELYYSHKANKEALDILENDLKQETMQKAKEEEARNTSLSLIAHADREMAALEAENNTIAQNKKEVNELIKNAESELKALESKNADISEAARLSEDFTKILAGQKEELNREASDIRVKIASLSQEIQSLCDRMKRAEDERAGYKRDILLKEQQRTLNSDEEKRIRLDSSKTQESLRQAEEDAIGLSALIKNNEEAYSANEKQLSELEKDIKAWSLSIEELTIKKHQFEVQTSRLEAELENFQANIWNEYEITYSNALKFKDESLTLTAINQEILKIKNDIAALGEVNVNAIGEYQRISDRYTFLTSQREDLLAAIEDLKKVIKDITITMDKKFREEFAIINKYFDETFRELFGGGHAELVLEDENDVLSCGIDIIAQPPGKKLQSLSLLSGGEKALTAIAILFAILKHKPTPFCVLDEIDAALDDTNVYQFSRFIKELKGTQFIIITHRKGTMEVSDIMYGIAMEEKGVSRLISVRFDEMVS